MNRRFVTSLLACRPQSHLQQCAGLELEPPSLPTASWLGLSLGSTTISSSARAHTVQTGHRGSKHGPGGCPFGISGHHPAEAKRPTPATKT